MKQSRASRRTARYKHRQNMAMDRCQICAAFHWMLRRIASSYGFGPRHLRGKGRWAIQQMLIHAGVAD